MSAFPNLANSSYKSTTTSSNIRRLRTAPGSPKPFLRLPHQSSEFYLRPQSFCFFRTDFHFKWIKIVEKVHHWIEDFCHFLGKMSLALIFSVFEKKLLFGVWKNEKTNVASFFRCIYDRQDEIDKTAEYFPTYRSLALEFW